MKIFFLWVLFLFAQELPDIISEFQLTNRLILIFSKNNQSELYQQTLLELARDPLGMAERDVLIFEIFTTGGIHPDGSALSEHEVETLWDFYQTSEVEFMIVLINAESKEIFRSEVPIKAASIISRFDESK